MVLPRPSSPRKAFSDLAAFFRTSGKVNYFIIGISITIPLAIVAAVLFDFRYLTNPDDNIVYGDIIPANPDDPIYKEWQARKLEDFNLRRDEQQRAEAAKRKSFQKLADDLGIKTDK